MKNIFIVITLLFAGCATSGGDPDLYKGELYISKTPTSQHSINLNPKNFYSFDIQFGDPKPKKRQK